MCAARSRSSRIVCSHYRRCQTPRSPRRGMTSDRGPARRGGTTPSRSSTSTSAPEKFRIPAPRYSARTGAAAAAGPRSLVMPRRGERGVWQRRYWELTIRDDRDFAAHMNCVHFNAVKHALVEHPAQWPHSSFGHSVVGGLYPAGWLGGSGEPPETGERRRERNSQSSGRQKDHSRPSLLGSSRLYRRRQRRKALRFSVLRSLSRGSRNV